VSRVKKFVIGYTIILYNILQESPDRETYFVKIHARWGTLLEGAEKLGLRMPFSVSAKLIVAIAHIMNHNSGS